MFLKNKRYLIVCLSFVFFVLIHNIFCICHDQYFLYRQGESILQNGFSVDHEYLTVHDFYFFNNRILSSLICYFFGSFGESGFIIGSVLLSCFLCFLLFFILRKYIARMERIYVFFMIVGFTGLSFFADLRANVLTAILIVVSVVSCEFYLSGKISFFVGCILWFVYGALSMWSQDSSFYMLVFVLMPYLFDFKFVERLSKGKVVTSGKSLRFLVFLILYLLGGLCTPYGAGAYVYVYKCMTAMHCSYVKYISEMQVSFLSPSNACFILLFFVLLRYCIVYRKFLLRVIYFLLGSVLLAIVAYRMQYFALVIVLVDFWILFRDIGAGSFNCDKDGGEHEVFGVSLIVVLCLLICAVFAYIVIDANVLYYYHHYNAALYVVDVMDDNVDLTDVSVYNCHPNMGSYLEYRHARPYIDDRSEFFDVYFNDKGNIIDKWYLITNFDQDDSVYSNFCDKYDFDYYIVTSDGGFCKYLSNVAFCNYSDDIVHIYSFCDDRRFVVSDVVVNMLSLNQHIVDD